mmetsp:Transcript_148424/g.261976  ORF Transcript_148424/g.261976 Transcript_148424/m.261976 type:complete len:169 (+) Transcript_148424:48-554(+)
MARFLLPAVLLAWCCNVRIVHALSTPLHKNAQVVHDDGKVLPQQSSTSKPLHKEMVRRLKQPQSFTKVNSTVRSEPCDGTHCTAAHHNLRCDFLDFECDGEECGEVCCRGSDFATCATYDCPSGMQTREGAEGFSCIDQTCESTEVDCCCVPIDGVPNRRRSRRRRIR